MSVQLVVEGPTDVPVATTLIADAGLEVTRVFDQGGAARLDDQLERYNRAALWEPWVVIRDLDRVPPCAPEFLRRRGFQPSEWMCFRLAVRELESWLLADAAALADFLSVRTHLIPVQPDDEPDPKRTLVNLARSSTRREIREALVPRDGRPGVVGPRYTELVIEFSVTRWSLGRASRRSPSLARARRAIRDLSDRWQAHLG